MSTVARPQLAHPFAEDLDGLALQLLLLAWVLRSLAPAPATRPGVLLVHADPFGLALAVVRLMPHHRIELSTRPGLEVHVDDVEDLHHQLRRQAEIRTAADAETTTIP